MRKLNPVITAGLVPALLAMGVGVATIGSVDFMVQGDIPQANAIESSTNMSTALAYPGGVSFTSDAQGQGGEGQGDPQPQGPVTYTFSANASYELQVSPSLQGNTKPFVLRVALPEAWGDDAQVGDVASSVQPSSRNVTVAKDPENPRVIVIEAKDFGLKANDRITLTFPVSVTSTLYGDNHEQQAADRKAQLEAATSPVESISFGEDWTVPAVATGNGNYELSSTSLYPTKGATGTFTAEVTGSVAGLRLSQPTLSTVIPGVTVTPGDSWSILNADGSVKENVAWGDARDVLVGERIRYGFQVASTEEAAGAMGSQFALATTISGTGKDGVEGSAMQQVTSSSPTIAISPISADIDASNGLSVDKTRPSAGDEVILAVKVTPTGEVARGAVKVALSRGTHEQVRFVEADGTQVDPASGAYAIIPFEDLTEPRTFYARIKVGEATDAALSGETFSFTWTGAVLGGTDGIADADPNRVYDGCSFTVAEAGATGASYVDDPALDIPAETRATEMVVNLGDKAEFQVEITNNTNDATIKGLKVKDSISAKDSSGAAITASTAKLAIPGEPQLYRKVTNGDTVTDEPIAAEVTFDDAARTSFTVAPTSPLDLAPGETVLLRYTATIGQASVKAMRGATVTNSPVATGDNMPAGKAAIAPASVSVATAQISPHLTVTEERIPVGSKTTYVLTVQSVKPEGAQTVTADNYAIGLHVAASLDPYSTGLGYAYDRSSVKLYQVTDGTMAEVPVADYEVVDDEEDASRFILSIKDEKAASHRIKVVTSASANTNKSGGSTDTSDVGEKETVDQGSVDGQAQAGGESAEAPAIGTEAVTKASGSDEKKDSVSLEAVAKNLVDGYIMTYEGTTSGIKDLSGSVTTNADALVRADNAGYAVDSKNVIILGEDMRETQYADATPASTGGTAGTTKKATTQGKGNLVNTDASAPRLIGALLTSVMALFAVRLRKISKR